VGKKQGHSGTADRKEERDEGERVPAAHAINRGEGYEAECSKESGSNYRSGDFFPLVVGGHGIDSALDLSVILVFGTECKKNGFFLAFIASFIYESAV
jgi:hypothetical protein